MRALKSYFLAIAIFALFISTGEYADAQSGNNQKVYDSLTLPQIMDIMKAQGYNVMLREENNAIAWFMVANSIGLISTDKPHSLNFYSYVKGGTATLKDANAWNKEKKYSKMYLDKDKDVVLELDLDLTGGVTEARIIDFIVTCRVSYNVWYKEFGPE